MIKDSVWLLRLMSMIQVIAIQQTKKQMMILHQIQRQTPQTMKVIYLNHDHYKELFLIFDYLEQNETEPAVDMRETRKETNRTINFKIKPGMIQEKKTKEIFEIDLPFSLMAEFSSIPMGYIIRKNLNEKQKLAIARLKTHLIQIFLNKFNRKTCIKTFYKSKLAYRIEIRCSKRCKFYWPIIYNIKSKKASVLNSGTIKIIKL